MQWGQIKTLLIISFLVLDIYLFVQFLEKKEESDIGILEHQTSTIEEQLADDNITYEQLPEEEHEETFISVKQKQFSEEELIGQNKQIEQDTTIIQKNFIVSKPDEPIPVSATISVEQLTNLFNNLVYFSEEYTFWNWNKEENIIVFFQNKLDRPVYYNQKGLVLLFLNEENEIVFYTQTMLGDTESLAEKRKLMRPMEAIETLYIANELPQDSHIDNVNIGFYTRVPFETEVQVFAPIWRINVNGERDYFVNAIEGFIFSTDEEEFLEQAIIDAHEKVRMQHSNNDVLEDVYLELEKRVEDIGPIED